MTNDPNNIGGELIEVRPGRSLHVIHRDVGANTTLVFIHGGGGNKNQWRNQWRHFSTQNFNLLAWDALGHGQSPQPRDPAAYHGDASLADALALFARFRTEHNVLIAHSMGARLAVNWLVTARSHIDAAVLLGPAPLSAINPSRHALFGPVLGRLPLPLLELFRPLLANAFRKRAWHPNADQALVRYEQDATKNNKLYIFQALLAGSVSPDPSRLPQIDIPVTILAGDTDGLVPPQATEALATALPRAKLITLPQTGHQIMLERPAETNQAIAQILPDLPHAH